MIKHALPLLVVLIVAGGCNHDLDNTTPPCKNKAQCAPNEDCVNGRCVIANHDAAGPDQVVVDLKGHEKGPPPDGPQPDKPKVSDGPLPDKPKAPDGPQPDKQQVPDAPLVADGPVTSDSLMPDTGPKKNWPFGKDGPLKIGTAYGKQKVTLWPGDLKDYSEIVIDSDGVLEVVPGSGWVIIGVNGNVTINGQVRARRQSATGLIAGNLPDANGNPGKGAAISHTIVQKLGGNGGKCAAPSSPAAGKAAYGNGGGGSSYKLAGKTATKSQGGDGAAADTPCTGGVGSTGQGIPGQPGGTICDTGGGGGGGFRGYHGNLLYFVVRGDVSGTGAIDARGDDGSAGGKGGDGCTGTSTACKGGGGGGGGAGGSGGVVNIKYTGNLKIIPNQVKVDQGKGGKEGANGIAHYAGSPGIKGQDGAPGAYNQYKWIE